jgi:hypothetical protein
VSFSTGEQALAALAALGHKLDERGTEPVSLLICGGAAMNISGLLTRLTADVDVLGDMHANGELGEMPDWIYATATEVAEELGLEGHWLNDAAASVTSMGLPSGILLRATRHDFGKTLQVAIISRLDLIALKCFAALNPGVGEKHLGDLVDFESTLRRNVVCLRLAPQPSDLAGIPCRRASALRCVGSFRSRDLSGTIPSTPRSPAVCTSAAPTEKSGQLRALPPGPHPWKRGLLQCGGLSPGPGT